MVNWCDVGLVAGYVIHLRNSDNKSIQQTSASPINSYAPIVCLFVCLSVRLLGYRCQLYYLSAGLPYVPVVSSIYCTNNCALSKCCSFVRFRFNSLSHYKYSPLESLINIYLCMYMCMYSLLFCSISRVNAVRVA